MKQFFEELFEYNLVSSESFLETMRENEIKMSERGILLINHIINAHHIWNNRIEQNELPYNVWELHKFADLNRLNKSNHERSFELIKDFSMEQMITYKTTKGQQFTNSVRDILYHVIHHSNYHRAQIANQLKTAGIQPPQSDFILFRRQTKN